MYLFFRRLLYCRPHNSSIQWAYNTIYIGVGNGQQAKLQLNEPYNSRTSVCVCVFNCKIIHHRETKQCGVCVIQYFDSIRTVNGLSGSLTSSESFNVHMSAKLIHTEYVWITFYVFIRAHLNKAENIRSSTCALQL